VGAAVGSTGAAVGSTGAAVGSTGAEVGAGVAAGAHAANTKTAMSIILTNVTSFFMLSSPLEV
jgi:hypothetical protein